MDNSATADVFGTFGAVLWSLQVIRTCANYSLSGHLQLTLRKLLPQIWKNWRRHDSGSLSHTFFLSWAIAGVPLGVYNIADDYNIALQIQPNILIFLSLLTWAQCQFYGKRRPIKLVAFLSLIFGSILGGIEVGLVFALRMANERGQKWTATLMAVVAAVLLAGGVLRHYADMWKTRSDAGLSLQFALLDAAGDVASLLSVTFQPSLSILGLVIYGSELVLWIGLIVIIIYFRKFRRVEPQDIN